ncbi:hypothetical protein DFH06DRAFT_1392317 [Mycena polygramma]|nr:hypothetical protein DFH06DRAFT_1392317 [Mycena polygramma]
MVHTGSTHSPHPVRPIGESKVVDSPDSPAASATPAFSDISLSGGAPADGDFASKVADTLLAADAAASTPAPASSSLGSAALNSSSPADTPQSFIDGSGEVGNTGSAADNNVPAASLQFFIDATPNPSFSSSDASLATGAHGAGALPTMSLEALNSAADTPAEISDAHSTSSGVPDAAAPDARHAAITGSTSLNSSNPNDKFPIGAPAANSSISSSSIQTTNLKEDAAMTQGGAEGEETEGDEEHKKPKLMQRLKDKMHLGHGHP